MPQCLSFDPAASAVVAVADSPCTTLVALTPAEYAALASSPFLLDASDGMLVAGSILGIWACAYSWRAAIKALSVDEWGSHEG